MAKSRTPTTQALKKRYDAAHRRGMQALHDHDLEAVSEAIAIEREIILEQKAIIKARLATMSRKRR